MRTFTVLICLVVASYAQTLEVPKWINLHPSLDSTAYLAEPMPAVPSHNYTREMWEPNWLTESWGRFLYAVSYPDSFVLSCTVGTSEPEIGYPYHYGNVTGINDTIKVRVYFNNKSSADLIMSGLNPETWFYPVLYNPYANVFKEDEIADTSLFDYEFAYWTPMLGHTIINEPDTIFSSLLNKNKPHYRMIYNLWGVPAGTFRVVLKPTAFLPSNVQIEVDNPNGVFHVINGQSGLDSVNAYLKTGIDAQYREEYTFANSYIDSVFILNSNSIPGWAMRYHVHAAQDDTSSALAAIDSLLNVIDNNLDPYYPDSSRVTEINEWWLEDYQTTYAYKRWKMRNPHISKYHLLW